MIVFYILLLGYSGEYLHTSTVKCLYVKLSTPKRNLVGKGISWKMRCCGISWNKTGIKLASAGIKVVKEKSAQAMERAKIFGHGV